MYKNFKLRFRRRTELVNVGVRQCSEVGSFGEDRWLKCWKGRVYILIRSLVACGNGFILREKSAKMFVECRLNGFLSVLVAGLNYELLVSCKLQTSLSHYSNCVVVLKCRQPNGQNNSNVYGVLP